MRDSDRREAPLHGAYGGGPGDVTHFSADHLYGARLRLDKKLNK